ncbi:serine hydrolase domain-containing protein [Williamsoniiplasma luminosum]|uniref:Beta-lactamase-related domain-containing protein n=1 Tax=Williamsoniiplasma luminosum TaxID=214888 RepID=A0A2S0NK58_9MOLU|nr:serine hydrolase domain-containing protein [Williamsoniiplasma luminosum]AVP49403.1 MAG: hypothetical protein C5T88_02335 [Williamsoniiplasma luminosum]
MSRFTKSEKCLEEFFDQKLFTGAVLNVYQNKKPIHHQAYGFNDPETHEVMRNDLIFMAYSLTKVSTGVAAMIGLEQGLYQLDDPVAKYIPEFANLTILQDTWSEDNPPAKNVLTIRHLLTMTGGMSLVWNRNSAEKQTTKLVSQMNQNSWTLQEFIKHLAKVPVLFEPGTQWFYGMCLDVMGAVIEVAAGKTFAQFLETEIFNKLDMPDTRFYITDKSREANVFVNRANTMRKVENFSLLMPKERYEQPNCALGGSGLFTTGDDYIKLANVLIDGVGLNGVRILTPESVKALQTDQLKALKPDQLLTFNGDYSYSFGMRVRIKNETYPITNIGEMGWDGFLGSTVLVDPEKKVAMVLMLSTAYSKNEAVQTKFYDAFYRDLANME